MFGNALTVLEDGITFSPVQGSFVILWNYSRAFDIEKAMKFLTPEQLAACEVPVSDRTIDSCNEGLE